MHGMSLPLQAQKKALLNQNMKLKNQASQTLTLCDWSGRHLLQRGEPQRQMPQSPPPPHGTGSATQWLLCVRQIHIRIAATSRKKWEFLLSGCISIVRSHVIGRGRTSRAYVPTLCMGTRLHEIAVFV
jgi:hypothetical protein